MRLALLAAFAFLVTGGPHAQTAPDLFSCIDASRLSAPRSYTYAVKSSSADYVDVEEIAKIEEPARQLLRITRTRYRDNAMTAAQIMHVDARTLAPLSYLHTSARTPNEPAASLAINGGKLSGHSYGQQPVSVEAAGPILFGNAPEEMLAGAVDWVRCPSVSARQLNVTTLDLRRELTMTRTGDGSFSFEGRELAVHLIAVRKGNYDYKLGVAKTAPFAVVTTEHGTPPSTKRLIKSGR